MNVWNALYSEMAKQQQLPVTTTATAVRQIFDLAIQHPDASHHFFLSELEAAKQRKATGGKTIREIAIAEIAKEAKLDETKAAQLFELLFTLLVENPIESLGLIHSGLQNAAERAATA